MSVDQAGVPCGRRGKGEEGHGMRQSRAGSPGPGWQSRKRASLCPWVRGQLKMAACAWTVVPPELAASSPPCEPRRHPASFGYCSMAEAMRCQLLLPGLREGHFLLVFKPSSGVLGLPWWLRR